MSFNDATNRDKRRQSAIARLQESLKTATTEKRSKVEALIEATKNNLGKGTSRGNKT